MPRFIDNLALRTVTWLVVEGIHLAISPIIERLDKIMAFVKVDSDKLAAVETELGSVSDAVQALIDNPDNNLTEDDLTGLSQPLDALRDKLAALNPAPVDNGGDTPPAGA